MWYDCWSWLLVLIKIKTYVFYFRVYCCCCCFCSCFYSTLFYWASFRRSFLPVITAQMTTVHKKSLPYVLSLHLCCECDIKSRGLVALSLLFFSFHNWMRACKAMIAFRSCVVGRFYPCFFSFLQIVRRRFVHFVQNLFGNF